MELQKWGYSECRFTKTCITVQTKTDREIAITQTRNYNYSKDRKKEADNFKRKTFILLLFCKGLWGHFLARDPKLAEIHEETCDFKSCTFYNTTQNRSTTVRNNGLNGRLTFHSNTQGPSHLQPYSTNTPTKPAKLSAKLSKSQQNPHVKF